MIRRRQVLEAAVAAAGLTLAPWVEARGGARRVRFKTSPFTAGVASGYPASDGMVLWTRLATDPLDVVNLLHESDLIVDFDIATDADFKRIVQSGTARAEARYNHTVHLEVHGLPAAQRFFYRFRSGQYVSDVGRSWTAPAGDALMERLRVAVASCQHYEQGYYHAYRHMLEADTDLILHLGDYIYENNTARPVRQHDRGECMTLEDYRRRYAWYRSDPLLRAAHAACPWLLTHDDHEVDNDYAAAQSEHPDQQDGFLLRRAAAYQAYWENLPLPNSARPRGPDMSLYVSNPIGGLLGLHMLDSRQYRSPQACPAPPRRGGTRVVVEQCPEWHRDDRSMLGDTQEAWLDAALRQSTARWNFLAQGLVFTTIDEDPGPDTVNWNDSWAGYPAARRRLLQSVAGSGVRNPLILGGDIHAFIAADQRVEPGNGDSPIVASELVTTSISSGPPPKTVIEAYNREDTRDVLFADGDHRGYLRLELTPQRLEAQAIGFASVRTPEASAKTLASFTLEDDQRGLRRDG